MQLVEVDRLDAEAAQRHLRALAQVVRVADDPPLARALPREAGLRRDPHVAVGVQRLADEVLGHERPVAVGGVDEVDAELDGAAQHGDARRRGRPARPRRPGPVICMAP